MTDNEIISQASEEQFNVACDATDASKNILSEASVIKVLECCFLSECDCKDCPYSDLEICDTAKMINIVIDLINRQKAEVERLTTMHSEMCIGMKRLKSEAIKAFAERLKRYKAYVSGWDIYVVREHHIDNLVKEMTENEGKE